MIKNWSNMGQERQACQDGRFAMRIGKKRVDVRVAAEGAQIARLAALMPADETQLLYSMCLHGQGELGLAPDEYAALTMVLLRLLAFKPRVAGSASARDERAGEPQKKTLNDAPAAAARPSRARAR